MKVNLFMKHLTGSEIAVKCEAHIVVRGHRNLKRGQSYRHAKIRTKIRTV